MFFCGLFSSCTILQPPTIRSYELKGKNNITAAIGMCYGWEGQVAYSPLNKVYIHAGYHRQGEILYAIDRIKYKSQNIGIGYYTNTASGSYIQFGGEFFNGTGNSTVFHYQGSHEPGYTERNIYAKGFTVNGLFSHYFDNLEIGLMFGSKIGHTWNSETVVGYSKYVYNELGVLHHIQHSYVNLGFAIFHKFNKNSLLSFNINSSYSSPYNTPFSAQLAYQYTFNLRKKDK
jgi:hypothetical protein